MDEPISVLEPAEPNLDQLTYIQKHTVVVLKKIENGVRFLLLLF